MIRTQGDRTGGVLARLGSDIGRLDAVIAGVAHHVNQRIAERLDHGAIDLGFFAFGDEPDLLARLLADVPHQPGHLLEGLLERNHPQTHRQVLQLANDLARMGYVPGKSPCLFGGYHRVLGHHRLGNHQFADHVDKLVQAAGRHANGTLGGRPCSARHLLLGANRIANVLGFGGALLDQRLADLLVSLGAVGLLNLIALDLAFAHQDVADTHRFDGFLVVDTRGLGIGQDAKQIGEVVRNHQRAARSRSVEPFDHHFQSIAGLQCQVGKSAGDADLAVAGTVQQILCEVRELLDAIEIQKAAGPLDRVERPEDHVDLLGILGIALQFQQRRLGHVDVVETFDDEVLHQVHVCRVGHHGRAGELGGFHLGAALAGVGLGRLLGLLGLGNGFLSGFRLRRFLSGRLGGFFLGDGFGRLLGLLGLGSGFLSGFRLRRFLGGRLGGFFLGDGFGLLLAGGFQLLLSGWLGLIFADGFGFDAFLGERLEFGAGFLQRSGRVIGHALGDQAHVIACASDGLACLGGEVLTGRQGHQGVVDGADLGFVGRVGIADQPVDPCDGTVCLACRLGVGLGRCFCLGLSFRLRSLVLGLVGFARARCGACDLVECRDGLVYDIGLGFVFQEGLGGLDAPCDLGECGFGVAHLVLVDCLELGEHEGDQRREFLVFGYVTEPRFQARADSDDDFLIGGIGDLDPAPKTLDGLQRIFFPRHSRLP